jgi:hypothetical protein
MLQITPQMRILVAVEAVDFRKGIDSLAELCRAKLNADPFSGCLFVFRSRRATSIKVLVYDGQGFWLATKRLSKGRFRWWPQVAEEGAEEPTRALRVIKRRCCSRRATPTSMPLQSGGRSSEGSSVDAQTFLTCVLKLFLSHCCHERGVVLSGPEHQR